MLTCDHFQKKSKVSISFRKFFIAALSNLKVVERTRLNRYSFDKFNRIIRSDEKNLSIQKCDRFCFGLKRS